MGGWGRWSVVAVLAVGVGLTGCQKAKSRVNINLSQAPKVVVEAENPDVDSLTAPMFIEVIPEASGGKCLTILEGSGKPGGERPDKSKYPDVWGKADYTVEIPSSGEWVFWGRAYWDDACGNSMDLSVDGSRPTVFGDDSFKVWHWVKIGTFTLAAGKHRIELLNREDGVRLDQLLLTTDAGYRPVGIEETSNNH